MEHFKIEMPSGPGTPQSLWADAWKCPLCQQVLSRETVEWEPMAPLHNPIFCTGKAAGWRHVTMPCDPLPGANVYLYTAENGLARDKVVGRIPS